MFAVGGPTPPPKLTVGIIMNTYQIWSDALIYLHSCEGQSLQRPSNWKIHKYASKYRYIILLWKHVNIIIYYR